MADDDFDDFDEEEFATMVELCPDCGWPLQDGPGGGVECPNEECGYWFCY